MSTSKKKGPLMSTKRNVNNTRNPNNASGSSPPETNDLTNKVWSDGGDAASMLDPPEDSAFLGHWYDGALTSLGDAAVDAKLPEEHRRWIAKGLRQIVDALEAEVTR